VTPDVFTIADLRASANIRFCFRFISGHRLVLVMNGVGIK
jgi:hypothetical protein